MLLESTFPVAHRVHATAPLLIQLDSGGNQLDPKLDPPPFPLRIPLASSSVGSPAKVEVKYVGGGVGSTEPKVRLLLGVAYSFFVLRLFGVSVVRRVRRPSCSYFTTWRPFRVLYT